MGGFLILDFLIGMQHALEADHVVAMGAMVNGEPGSRRSLVLRSAAWGLGHTITLFAICSAVLLMGFNLTNHLESMLEFCVGIMLVLLGVDVMRRLWIQRIHFHVHTHDDKKTHIHAHSHLSSKHVHAVDPHNHMHRTGWPKKALVIGLMHGGAGSAGLLALAVAATQNTLTAISYVLIFGIGSIAGMSALTLIATWPLKAVEAHVKWIYKGVSLTSGIFAIYIGVNIMLDNGQFLGVVSS